MEVAEWWERVENQEQVSTFPPPSLVLEPNQKQPTASAKKRGHFYRGNEGDITNEA
jgi:hypothetical protein